MTLVHRPPGFKAKRLLLAGAGPREKVTPAELRRISGAALRHAKSKSLRDIVFFLDAEFAKEPFVAAAVEGAILGDFEPDRYKTDKKDIKVVDSFAVGVAGGEPGLENALERGRIVGESQNLTRDLVSE